MTCRLAMKFLPRCCGPKIIGCYAPSGEHCERPLEVRIIQLPAHSPPAFAFCVIVFGVVVIAATVVVLVVFIVVVIIVVIIVSLSPDWAAV